MSPETALHNDVFRLYVVMIAVILGIAGMLLGILRRSSKHGVGSVLKTYKGWLIMAPLALGCIFAGRIPFIVFITIVAMAGLKEFSRATGLYQDWWLMSAMYLGAAAVGLTSLISDPAAGTPGWYGLFMALPIYVIAMLLIIPIARNNPKGQLQALALSIVGFIYIGWMFGHLAFLADAKQSYGYLLYLLFAVETNDVSAFVFGKLLGRHPLRNEISPNKTWEGSLGALGVSLILPWLLHFSFPQFGPLQLVLTGLIVGIGGQMGDLSMSVIKRDLGIKDMGGLIQGHGGILDRVDSLIYTAPLFFHMVRYFYDIH
jgi:phosphatidate cytidylyltransferase